MLHATAERLAHSIRTYLLIGPAPVHVRGGRATGKSAIAARVAVSFADAQPNPVWLVAETVEGARHSAYLVEAEEPSSDNRVVLLTSEDYEERVALDPQEPALIVFDDADRYDLQVPDNAHYLLCTTSKHPGLPVWFGADYLLETTRTREELRRTLEAAGLPGIAPTGQPSEVILHSSQAGTRRLTGALNAWGVVCVPVHSDGGNDALFRVCARLTQTLSTTTLANLDELPLHESPTPRLAIAVSSARSGRLRTITEAEAGLALDTSLLEDLAAERPDVTVVVCTDDDEDHLARLLSATRLGALVVAPVGSPTHRKMSRFVLDL